MPAKQSRVAEKVEYLENEAWIARRRPPTQNRIDKATALLHRKGGQPPARKTQFPSPTKTGNASRIATPVAGPDNLPPPIIRRQQVKPPIFYRIASVLMLLFAAGHTLGFRQNVPEWGADAALRSCAPYPSMRKALPAPIGTSSAPSGFISPSFLCSPRSWPGC